MNNIQFPSYLAFGRLNEKSIRTENEYQVADYELLGEKVMEVHQSPDRAHIKDFFRGNGYACSTYPDLESTFMCHYMCVRPSDNPILDFLIKNVCALGNIYFEHIDEDPNKPKMIFYPAGYLFVIRIPVTKENIDSVKKIVNDEYVGKQVHDIYDTQLIVTYKNGEKETKNIQLLELITPVAFVYDTAKWLVENKVILKEKILRVIIQNSSEKGFGFANIFMGAESDDWAFYSIIYKPLIPGEGKKNTA